MATPYMSLALPTPSVTAGPEWASELNDALTVVDGHDHILGLGKPIRSAALLIDEDVPWNGYNLTSIRSLRLANQGSALSALADVGCVYEAGGDLYFNNSAGQQVQITSGVGLNAASIGGIGGDYVGSGASVSYLSASHSFLFFQAANQYASLEAGAILIREAGATSPYAVTLQSPAALSAAYALTLPAALPASTLPLQISSAGVMSTGKLTGAMIADNVALGGKPTATATVAGDGSTTLATKGYTDATFFPAGTGYASGGTGGTNIDLVGQSDTVTAPAASRARLTARRAVVNVASSPLLAAIIDDTGLRIPMGPRAGFTGASGQYQECVPAWGVNTVTGISGGPATAQTWAVTSRKTRSPRVRMPQVAGSDSVLYGDMLVWRGNGSGLGGFIWIAEWGLAGTVNVNQRVIVGLAGTPSTVSSNPYNKSDIIAFGCSMEDTLQVFSNDNVGTATIAKDLGANFPAADGTVQDTLFRTAIWAGPNASSINWAIERLDAGPYFDSGTISSDLPRNTVQLAQEFGLYESSANTTRLDYFGSILIWNP